MLKHRTRLIALLLIMALAMPSLALAQDGDTDNDIVLVPYTNYSVGIRTLVPSGWAEVKQGIFARDDNTVLLGGMIPNMSIAEVIEMLTTQLNLEAPPVNAGSRETEAFAWKLYTTEITEEDKTAIIDLALVEDADVIHLIFMQVLEEEYDALHAAVFLPAIDAFELLALSWGREDDGASPEEVTVWLPEVVAEYPHDTGAFTQGLIWYEDTLYESTGRHGESTLRQVDIESGTVLRSVDVAEEYFAEGLERVGDRLIQLSWLAAEAFVYDLETFEQIDTFQYVGEGWGLCYDEEYLYMSNGSPVISIRDPETFELISEGLVTIQGAPVEKINELACVGDYIYANVWKTDFIVQIDKTNGYVVGLIDASSLLSEEAAAALTPGADVLNGIAYNPDHETFYLTGKHWPTIFEVTLVERE